MPKIPKNTGRRSALVKVKHSRKHTRSAAQFITDLYMQTEHIAGDLRELITDTHFQIHDPPMDRPSARRLDLFKISLAHVEAATAILLRAVDT